MTTTYLPELTDLEMKQIGMLILRLNPRRSPINLDEFVRQIAIVAKAARDAGGNGP